ncbi:MAG: 50S ribosomal protein L4 [Fidelibacterota bacterium]
MDILVKNSDGSESKKIKVDKSVFGIEPNMAVIHQAVEMELTNMRQGTHSSKTRGKVSGGGKKPWKQKGRGAARAGSTRSPIWRGGGTVFGPQPHPYGKHMPKKMNRLARRSVLSGKAAENAIIVIDKIELDGPRTKVAQELLMTLGIAGKKVVFLPAVVEENVLLSFRNIKNVTVIPSTHASTYDLVDSDVLLFDKAGLALLNETLSEKN